MFRGTTPTITIVLPDDITSSSISNMWVTMSQNGEEKLNKTLTNFTNENQKFSCQLTQEETLDFNAAEDMEMQIRLLLTNGKALASKIYRLKVDDILKDGEIQ